jgi:hypothetical protein
MTVQTRGSSRLESGPRHNFRATVLVALCVASLAGGACATPSRRSTLMAQTTEVKTDERAMRVALYEYTYLFLIILAKRNGFFAPHSADSVVHDAPKVVAKT